MKKLLLTVIAFFAITAYANEPLKITSFTTKLISPEANVDIITLQTRHNGDPEKVKLTYSVFGKGASVKKYDNYDILDMGTSINARIKVVATDGETTDYAVYTYTKAYVDAKGYYTNEQQWNKVTKNLNSKGEEFRFVENDPKLPNVLIIGNSISIGYTPYVRENLEGVANLYRVPENAGNTPKGLSHLDFWLSDMKWDVIHVNWGLHDLKYTLSKDSQDVPVDRYKENLRKLLARLKKSGAKIIWAQTSVVPEGVKPRRDIKDPAIYNKAAASVVKEFKGIVIDDQYKLTKANPKNQIAHNVHFHPEGYKQQADQATKYILKALKK